MFKANKLLRVVSILLIVFGALGAVGSIGIYFAAGQMTNLPVSVGSTILAVVIAIVEVAIGIIGIKAKQEKIVMIAAIVYLLIAVYNLISGIIAAGFSPLSLLGFILPILYFWGYYQSK